MCACTASLVDDAPMVDISSLEATAGGPGMWLSASHSLPIFIAMQLLFICIYEWRTEECHHRADRGRVAEVGRDCAHRDVAAVSHRSLGEGHGRGAAGLPGYY